MHEEDVIRICKENGVSNTGIINIPDIDFNEQLRDNCKLNTCGRYNTNWTCPPRVGDFDVLVKKVFEYKHAIVFQNIYELEDSFDYEGMERGSADHYQKTQKIAEQIKKLCPDALVLGAGGCRVCKECAAVKNEPCRFPDKAVASMEAYGMYVSNVASKSGLEYMNGVNTMTYFGMVLY